MTLVLAPGIIDNIESAIAWLNTQHALIYDGSRTLIWSRIEDPSTKRKVWRQSSVSDFRTYYSSYLVPDGARMKSLADAWLAHPMCRRYRDVVFSPALSATDAATAGVLNLWTGFAVPPVQGDWSHLKEHIYEVVAGGRTDLYDYVIGWMARMVQVPSEPAGTAVVMRGQPGAGKGILARALGRLLGDHFIHISHTGQLTSRFNGVLADALMIFADEAVWAGDRPGEGALKALITEPTLAIERKGREITTVRNVVHLMMASNQEWVAPVGLRDRRFCVVDVLDSRIGDRPYFHALAHEQSNGGAGAMLYDLLRYDLDQFVPAIIPKTNARLEQALKSLDPTDRWWHECLLTGMIGQTTFGRVGRDEIYNALLATLKRWEIRYIPTPSDLGKRLKLLTPSIRSVQGTLGSRSYLPPDLPTARQQFDAYLGDGADWPEPDSED